MFGLAGAQDVLRVTLLWANSLPVGDCGDSTLHVLCRAGRTQRRSTSLSRSANPEWDEGGEKLELALETVDGDAEGVQEASVLRLAVVTTPPPLLPLFEEILSRGEATVKRPSAALNGDTYLTVPLDRGGSLQLRIKLIIHSQPSRDALRRHAVRRLQAAERRRQLPKMGALRHLKEATDGKADDATKLSEEIEKAKEEIEKACSRKPATPGRGGHPGEEDLGGEGRVTPTATKEEGGLARVKGAIEGLNTAIDLVSKPSSHAPWHLPGQRPARWVSGLRPLRRTPD